MCSIQLLRIARAPDSPYTACATIVRMTAGNEATEFDARTQPLGYETRVINGQYFVYRLDNGDRMRVFVKREYLEKYIEILEATPSWRLDLTHGNVDVDRKTGIVTPHDGAAPFSVVDAQGWSGIRSAGDIQLNAEFLHIYTQDRPRLGGAWHKSGGF